MTASTLIQENLTQVAVKASWAFMLLERGNKSKLENAQKGLELLKLLGRAHAASKKRLEFRTEEEAADHGAVRRCFFVDRVPSHAPGWQEWNAAIDRAFDILLGDLMGKMDIYRKQYVTSIVLEDPEGSTYDQIDATRDFFAKLALLLNEPPR